MKKKSNSVFFANVAIIKAHIVTVNPFIRDYKGTVEVETTIGKYKEEYKEDDFNSQYYYAKGSTLLNTPPSADLEQRRIKYEAAEQRLKDKVLTRAKEILDQI